MTYEYDPHHCKCFEIPEQGIATFRTVLESIGFADTPFQMDQGQMFGLIKSDGNGKQMHVRVMPSGRIEAEVEPSHEYPFAHLNPLHSFSAHPELEDILKNYFKNLYHRKLVIPPTCIKRVIINPDSPIHVVWIIIGTVVVVIGLAVYALYKRTKKKTKS